MPAPVFGFSAGDFLSAILLTKKVIKALQKTGGAVSEYQDAIVELKSLENVLRQLESLEPDEDNADHVNAIRCMALACQFSLHDFLKRLERYEASLGSFGNTKWHGGIPQKSKWAVSFGEEVEKLRATVAAKVVSINLLLTMNLSQVMSKKEARLKKRLETQHAEILSKNDEQIRNTDRISKGFGALQASLNKENQARKSQLAGLSSEIASTTSSILSLRSIGQQILEFLSSFPSEMRCLLKNSLQSNWQIYQMLIGIQQSISRPPSGLIDSNIKFEDAMGEPKQLPYEFFRDWEPFEGFLRAHFRNRIGESKIYKGQYHIIDLSKPGVLIKKEHWTRYIERGAHISMSMVMDHLQSTQKECPRLSCKGAGSPHGRSREAMKCNTCNLTFFAKRADVEELLDRVVIEEEDEEVARQQIEDDIRTYGRRVEPPDVIELDEEDQLRKLPPKKNKAEFEAAVGRPSKKRKKAHSQDYNYTAITTVDWHAGETPLSAWLNQSAVPSMAVDNNDDRRTLNEDYALLAQEKNEIEIFRNVHIETVTEAARVAKDVTQQDFSSDLELDGQIFYRNILDRFPSIVPYLARRFAMANQTRAKWFKDPARLKKHNTTVMAETDSFASFEALPFVRGITPEILPMAESQLALNQSDRPTVEQSPSKMEFKEIRDLDGFDGDLGFAINGDWTARTPVQKQSLPEAVSEYDNGIESRQNLDLNLSKRPLANTTETSSRVKSPPQLVESADKRYPCRLCDRKFRRPQHLARHERRYHIARPYKCILCHFTSWRENPLSRHFRKCPFIHAFQAKEKLNIEDTRHKAESTRRMLFDIQDQGQEILESNFWTRRRSSQRTSSNRSCSSSRNDSLHGLSRLDTSYQSENYVDDTWEKSSAGSNNTGRGLFAAPIEWEVTQSPAEKKISFNCEICGCIVRVDRKRDWQRHVMRDLCPYVCTTEDCESAEVYSTIKEYLEHEVNAHELHANYDCTTNQPRDRKQEIRKRKQSRIKCPFCGQMTDEGKGPNSRGPHIGQHMEEIAFLVISKPYEDWEFYQDSSSASSSVSPHSN